MDNPDQENPLDVGANPELSASRSIEVSPDESHIQNAMNSGEDSLCSASPRSQNLEEREDTSFYLQDSSGENPLVYTSLLFSTNAITAFMASEYIYSALFVALTITSVIVHNRDEPFINILDKIVIGCIFVKGSLLLQAKYPTSHPFIVFLVFATFMYCVLSYCVGSILKRWCLDPDTDVGNKWHAVMHLLGSWGHHLIALM